MSQPRDILLFDGVCNLCNGTVDFILRHDKRAHFLFGSLQSERAQAMLKESHVPVQGLETFVLLRNGHYLLRSDAVLEVLKELGGPWKLAYGLKIIPRFIRDGVYRWIARHRYRLFGRRHSCRLPTPEEKIRFIDNE